MEATPPLCHQGRSDRGANGEGLLVRLHKYVVLVGLAMLLYLANFLVGCEKEQSPSVYYGPRRTGTPPAPT